MQKFFLLKKIALSTFLISLIWLALIAFKFFCVPLVTVSAGVIYTVREGTTIQAVTEDLYARRILKQPLLFMGVVRLKGVSSALKAGEYLFPQGTTSLSLLQQLITGRGLVYYPFTIVPGWTFRDVRAALLRHPSIKQTLFFLNNEAIMKQLNSSILKPEGEFFPDTYYFTRGASDISLLRRSFKRMQEKLDHAWQGRAPGLPFKNKYEALIAASIIEKEAYLSSELPRIAGVLVNRLRKKMLLQFDPTVIYGLGKQYEGKIHRVDLLKETPYNTYVRKGLPPTPISMPSLLAIEAVMHPESHGFYYFVAVGEGRHHFSRELKEHQKVVSEVQQ